MNKSIKFQLGGSNRPKITSGGSSDTTTLNRYFDALSQDISSITYEFLDLVDINQDLKLYADAQADGFQGIFTAIETTLANLSSTGQVLANPASTSYIDGTNTAELTGKYGQATLPIASSNNLLVYSDVYGENYIPQDVRVVWGTTQSVGTNLFTTEPTWNYDPNIERVLLGTGPWIRPWNFSTGSSTTIIWVKIELPLKFQNQRPNVLEFTPCPVFSQKLVGAYYTASINEPTSNWTAIDMTYQIGYNPDQYGNSYVNNVGPTRLFLPDETMSAIIFGFKLDTETSWGLGSMSLTHKLFETTAQYVVQNPYGNISSIAIIGKDPSDLANLSQTISTNTASIQLGTTDPSITPVITGVIMDTA